MIDTLRPFLGRGVALLIAWVAAHLTARYHITVTTEQQVQFSNAVVDIITGFIAVWFASHKIFDKWFNPGDAASSHIAAQEKAEAVELKAQATSTGDRG